MTTYILATHSVAGRSRPAMTDEQMQESYQQVMALEAEMKQSGVFLFSGALHGPETSTVVRPQGGEVLTTDGPFAESKEQLAGFYLVEADDLDAALGWATRTAKLIGQPIEVRPFMHADAG